MACFFVLLSCLLAVAPISVVLMLPRKPTRIELKPQDKEEYENLKALHEQLKAAAQEDSLVDPLQVDKRSTAARIGLRK